MPYTPDSRRCATRRLPTPPVRTEKSTYPSSCTPSCPPNKFDASTDTAAEPGRADNQS